MNKNVKIGIGAAVLILLAVFGLGQYYKQAPQENDNFIKEISRNLAPEDRKVFEDRIVDFVNKLNNSKDSAEKYNLYIQIGFTEYTLGHLQESKNNFLEAIKISPDQYDSHLGLFQTQVDMQDYKGAEASIKKAISIRKGIGDLWRRYIQFKIDRVNAPSSEITALFEEALKDTAQNGDAANSTDIFTSYATWLEKSGNLQSSIEYWKKAIEANPESKKIYQAEIDRIEKK